ncbi:hypothetical protein [Endozoicomonas elysicola]|uniref:hypothetical protein n=1 Tax=Endozoicomonas elysicola TaxID=305900 RepID=UPI0012695B65|nr:hypothetical protein [Endozoicomonas elysicola]
MHIRSLPRHGVSTSSVFLGGSGIAWLCRGIFPVQKGCVLDEVAEKLDGFSVALCFRRCAFQTLCGGVERFVT